MRPALLTLTAVVLVSCHWTWQAFGGVGYRFDWGSMVLGFRNLSYDMSAGKPVQNMSMTGPILTFNWRW